MRLDALLALAGNLVIRHYDVLSDRLIRCKRLEKTRPPAFAAQAPSPSLSPSLQAAVDAGLCDRANARGLSPGEFSSASRRGPAKPDSLRGCPNSRGFQARKQKLRLARSADNISELINHNRAIAPISGKLRAWSIGRPPNIVVLQVLAMDNKPDRNVPQASDQLHPWVYRTLAGLAIWLVVSAWVFFSQGGYLRLDLGIVSALVFMIIAIPTTIHHAGRRFQAACRTSRFGAWISGDFETRQGRRKSFDASVEILLPMMTAVIGITAIGIVFRLTEAGSSWL